MLWWGDSRFLQVDLGERASDSWYSMEYTDPENEGGGIATTPDLDVVIETFQRYAVADPAWTDHAVWS